MKSIALMKLVALGIVLSAVVGCQKSPSSSHVEPSRQSRPEAATIDEHLKVRAIAAKDALFNQLSGRLTEIMQSRGPADAIEVCSNEASQFAVKVSEQMGVKIGRTALKLRNAKNRPPSWSEGLISESATEPQFVQVDSDTVGALLPIKLQQKCLHCHGPLHTIAQEVRDKLQRYYPNDQAIGFNEGDLRGWFWVEVPTNTDDAA